MDRSSPGPSFQSSRGLAADTSADHGADESMVTDARAALRPAEIVERKLVQMLRGVVLPVSHLGHTFRKR